MIVKDESRIIRRALESVTPHIDYWVIHDTGSGDGTQDIVRTVLQGIPGTLREVPWVNFGHNRTLALQEAKQHADYTLILDADLVLSVEVPFRGRLGEDAYDLRYQGALDYVNTRLVSNRLDWKYFGVTHEYIGTEAGYIQPVELPGVTLIDHGDGSSRPDKFRRDIQLLREFLKTSPDDPRSMFYLAQSYRDIGDYENAHHWYARRSQVQGWDEERWYAMFQLARCQQEAGHHWEDAHASYIRAFAYRPTRLEPLYYLVQHYRMSGQPEVGMVYGALWKQGFPYPASDRLFIDKNIYDYQMAYEFGMCCKATGRPHEAVSAFLSMLKWNAPLWAAAAANAQIKELIAGYSA